MESTNFPSFACVREIMFSLHATHIFLSHIDAPHIWHITKSTQFSSYFLIKNVCAQILCLCSPDLVGELCPCACETWYIEWVGARRRPCSSAIAERATFQLPQLPVETDEAQAWPIFIIVITIPIMCIIIIILLRELHCTIWASDMRMGTKGNWEKKNCEDRTEEQ